MKFEEELTIENRARQSKRQSEFIRREINGENIYTLFCGYGVKHIKKTPMKRLLDTF